MNVAGAVRFGVIVGGVLAAPAAHALEMEFYTWNSFEETVAGFQRVALVLQDPGFLVFALVFAVLGTMVGLLTMAAKGVMGQQINPVSILIPSIIGIAIFRGLIIPTGTIHIYDPVRNAYQPVGDVPDAVILVAGVLNKIERGVVEIIATAAADPAAERSGSLRYSLILNGISSKRQDTYFERNAAIYFLECGLPSMGTGFSAASMNDVLRNSTDLFDVFAQWAHPSLYATIYSGAADEKLTVTCSAAWTNYLFPVANTAAGFADMKDGICHAGGFDVSVATQAARCEEELVDLGDLYGVAHATSLPFLRSVSFAQSIADAMRDADVSVQTGALINRQAMAEGFGAAEAMDRWIPKLRGFMTATVLGLLPLVFLFMLTPVMGKALSLATGLFLWLVLWGVSDAISVQMAVDAAADAFDQMSRFHFSYEGLMLSPEAAVQALGVFGKSRTMALMLATVLSYGLFSFGGYAFTSMAQAWQSDLTQAGEAAGRTALYPEERGAMLGRLVNAAGPEAAVDRSGFQNASLGAAMGDVSSAARAAGMRPYVGGQVGGGVTPGGAGGTDTTPALSSPSPSEPPPSGPAGMQSGGAYISDRVNGVVAGERGSSALPGGAGGVDTSPWATQRRDDGIRAASAPGRDTGGGGRASAPGGAGGVDTTPSGTAPESTPPLSDGLDFERLGSLVGLDPRLSTPGGAGGTDRTPRLAGTTTTSAEGIDAEFTVTSNARPPRERGPAPRNVLDVAQTEGEIAAGEGLARRAAYTDLAAEMRRNVTGAVQQVSTPAEEATAFGKRAFAEGLASEGLDGRDAGVQDGGLRAGGVAVKQETYENLNLGQDRTVEGSVQQARFTARSELASSGVLGDTDRGINVERIGAARYVAKEETVGARNMEVRSGQAAGEREIWETRITEGSLSEYGENPIVAGGVVNQGFSVYRAEAIEEAPGSIREVQRGMVRAGVADEIATSQVQAQVSDVLGGGEDMSSRIDVARAQRGAHVSIGVSGDGKEALLDHLSERGVVNAEQRSLISGQPAAVVTLTLDSDGAAQASIASGTQVGVSNSTTVNDEESLTVTRSVRVAGDAQALEQFDHVLMKVYDGKPAVNELGEGQRRALVTSIANTLESAYGLGVSADSSESLQYGVRGQVGAETPGGKLGPVSAGGDVYVGGSETLSSGARRNSVYDFADKTLDAARADAIEAFEEKYPGMDRARWDQDEFAKSYAEGVRSRVEGAVAAIRGETQHSAESDGTVEKLEELTAPRSAESTAERERDGERLWFK